MYSRLSLKTVMRLVWVSFEWDVGPNSCLLNEVLDGSWLVCKAGDIDVECCR